MRSTSLASCSTPGSSDRRNSCVWDIRRRDDLSFNLNSSDVDEVGWEGLNGQERRSAGRRVGWEDDMYVEYLYFSRPKVR